MKNATKKMILALRRDWFVILILFGSPMAAGAAVDLELGDILVAEPVGVISVIDPSTGAKTVVAQGGLLSSSFKTVGVAFAPDGDLIVVRRDLGLIRVNPVTESQSILSQGGLFSDPWAVAIDNVTGYIYVADSGYDNDRPEINEAGKIIRVDPVSGAQQLIASGSACNFFPANAACQNTTSAGSYLAHPYGIAIDYSTAPDTIVVADMSSFNGNGAIIRIQAVPNGAQTLVWGPATASPAPQVAQSSPLGCPMGVAVEPNGNILTTTFTYPVPSTPTVPPPAGTFYGCAAPGIFRLDLTSNVQAVVNTNAPAWQSVHAYAVGDVIRDPALERVHRVMTPGTSQGSPPSWNGAPAGTTVDGSVVWQNIGLGANWLIPFGLAVEPAPTTPDPLHYNLVVMDEGYSSVFRLDADGHFLAPTPLAGGFNNAPSLHVITVPPSGPPDPPPARSNGQPTGVLPAGTTQTTLGLTTDEAATCRYSTQAGVAYGSMTNTFTTTGATTHSTTVSGLTNQSYSFYVRCADGLGNANTNDFVIAFTVGSSSATTSTFVGTESVLNEGGKWDSPGAWADLQKDNGAFTTGLNAQARLVTPAVAADQYAEITYDQDPGSSSWVGVVTRIQGAGNGSGYLAIAFAGEVQLYRTDDTGGLNFTLLAQASAAIGTAPRRLRLESQGNTHRVYFNGVLMITHVATGTIYATGQPGIAASVFGGPQVKILSFEGGSLGAGPVDTTPPETTITSGPDGVTSATSATFTFASNEAGSTFECRLDGAAFAACTSPRTLTGLALGSHTFEVRATDSANNTDPSPASFSWVIQLAGGTPLASSTFVGTESVLNEGGMWDSPGSWADLRKDNGAFTTGLNAQARLVTPGVAADQYAQITYDQDPGLSGQSWVGVATRIQGVSNGSGYLAIAYQGEVRLYRTDDIGGLNFTLLAQASAPIGIAPRRLRLESEGNTHRVFFNGVLMINHVATAPIYATGQPGLAASVFGGPQVKILSFEGGNLSGGPVDAIPPETTITSGPNEVTSATSATFTFASNEAGSTFACRLDGAAFAACTSPRTLTGLAVGSHTFEVRATDSANNTDPSPASLSWTVEATDTTPPETIITGGPNEATNATSATFEFTANEAGSTFACRLDGAAFAACTSPRTLTGLALGSHTFEVRATDSANNTDPSPASLSWVIDRTAPDTVIVSGPPSLTNSTNATFTFTSSETASTFECRLDNEVFAPCSTPISYSSLASGNHTFRVRAIDAAGNVDASPAVHSWSVDATAPNTTLTGTPAAASNSSSATFTFTASEANSTFQCRLDGAAPSPCASPVTYSNLAQGSHNFQVQATDPAGNIDPTQASFSWTVDTVVPNTTIGSGPPSLSNSGSASFTFSSSEAGATFQCSLDGGSFANCTSPRTYGGLLDGVHTFQVRARDAAGNVDQTPSSYGWTVDRTAPTSSITSGPPTPTNVTTASFTFTSNDPTATLQCRLDGAAFAPCGSPVNYSGLANGNHTFRVRAVDPAGNIGAVVLYTWNVDTSPPNTSITGRPPAVTTSTSATFTFTASQAGSTLACSLDGAGFAPCSSPLAYTGLAVGSHSFRVRATDPAGNTDPTPAVANWTIQ